MKDLLQSDSTALRLKFTGTSGHGSLLLPNTAGVKLNYVINKLTEFRNSQVEALEKDSTLSKGDVTTVNLTQLSGGVQSNVVPPDFEAIFDMRLAITLDMVAFEKQIRDWCDEAGGGIEVDFFRKEPYIGATKLDVSNPYWLALKESFDELWVEFLISKNYNPNHYVDILRGLKVHPIVCPGATDSRYIRQKGTPAIGFSPIINTTMRIHDHDEFISADVYLRGVEVYKSIISKLSQVWKIRSKII